MHNKSDHSSIIVDQSNVSIRRTIKLILMAPINYKCQNCEYDRSINHLTFHHKFPSQKRFNISSELLLHPLQILLTEASKCIVVCHNCHGEINAGILDVSHLSTLKYNYNAFKNHK